MNMKTVRVRKEEALCKQCGKKKSFYYLSDYSYGERLVMTKDLKCYAYANLIEDKAFEELEKYIKLILECHNITLSEKQIAKCINDLFGITCDYIRNQPIDTASRDDKCLFCGSDEFGQNISETIEDIEIPSVTHTAWDKLNEDEKINVIKKELKKQNYIN
ncbi:hypothetical protein EHE19_010705 [Ruminiclostridium herbifermentans]|uniref:Uncharacterized protein n=1 Tax=Ruminiclostridium herbifermentans TaxID=2488810 RepID=A0A4U7JMJ7_9FIRM|nr:hypothetical protein [Ruminiclostridium herbifermentans]QNU65408.1 hypothetical protein EHE19_010705 [Ruminiclostridium herbifermentans]